METSCALILLLTAVDFVIPGSSGQPAGRLSTVQGARAGTGGLADPLGVGCAAGFEAGYQPMGPDQRIGWGVSWATLLSWYGPESSRVADQLAMIEMDAGVRLRVALGQRRRLVLFGGGGGAFVRVNEPVAGGDRDHVAPWGTAGIEFMLRGRIIGIEMRYGAITDGSGTIGLQLQLGRGV